MSDTPETPTPVTHDLIKALVHYEGQTYELPPQIAASDSLLCDALRPLGVNFDAASYARDTEQTPDGSVLHVRITKAYATKGSADRAPDGTSGTTPAVTPEAAPGAAAGDALPAGHPFAILVDAEPFVSPVIALAWRLRQAERDGALDYLTLLTTRAEIDTALKRAEREAEQARAFVRALTQAQPVPLTRLLEGI